MSNLNIIVSVFKAYESYLDKMNLKEKEAFHKKFIRNVDRNFKKDSNYKFVGEDIITSKFNFEGF